MLDHIYRNIYSLRIRIVHDRKRTAVTNYRCLRVKVLCLSSWLGCWCLFLSWMFCLSSWVRMFMFDFLCSLLSECKHQQIEYWNKLFISLNPFIYKRNLETCCSIYEMQILSQLRCIARIELGTSSTLSENYTTSNAICEIMQLISTLKSYCHGYYCFFPKWMSYLFIFILENNLKKKFLFYNILLFFWIKRKQKVIIK